MLDSLSGCLEVEICESVTGPPVFHILPPPSTPHLSSHIVQERQDHWPPLAAHAQRRVERDAAGLKTSVVPEAAEIGQGPAPERYAEVARGDLGKSGVRNEFSPNQMETPPKSGP